MDPIQFVLPKVIEATNRVLVSNAQLDFVVLTNGTLMSIRKSLPGPPLPLPLHQNPPHPISSNTKPHPLTPPTENMTWGGTLGFTAEPSTPIVITLPDLQYAQAFIDNGYPAGFENPQGTMGVQHYERGLMWAETYLSGHMQPQFQPRVSYRHLQWVLGRIEEL